MAFIGGIASIYTTGLWDFAFARFIVGTSYDSCFMTMYILGKLNVTISSITAHILKNAMELLIISERLLVHCRSRI